MLLRKLCQLVELVRRVLLGPDDLFQVERDLELNLFPRGVAPMNHLLTPDTAGRMRGSVQDEAIERWTRDVLKVELLNLCLDGE